MKIICQILIKPSRDGVFHSGEPVIGTLKYTLDAPTSFDSIIIHFKGKGKCSWSESDGDSTSTYSGKEKYVTIKKNVLERSNMTLLAGNYSHPFEFYLPENIPSTYKDKTCIIKYEIIATFTENGSLFGGTKKFNAEITVYGYVEPCSAQPLLFGLTKTPFSLSSSKSIDLKVNIEKTMLMPGENIKLQCTVNNDTDVAVSGITTKLINYTTYISDGKSTDKNKTTIKESKVKCAGVTERSTSNFTYTVPTLPNLYSIQYSEILIREYRLQVTAEMPFPHRNASVEIPVVIGESRKSFEEKPVVYEESDLIADGVSYFVDGVVKCVTNN